MKPNQNIFQKLKSGKLDKLKMAEIYQINYKNNWATQDSPSYLISPNTRNSVGEIKYLRNRL